MKHTNAIILILGLMMTSNCCGFPSRRPNELETTPGYQFRDDINEFDDWIWPNNEDDFAKKYGLDKKGGWGDAIAYASPVTKDNGPQNRDSDDGFKDFDDEDEDDQGERENKDIAKMLLGDLLEESNDKVLNKRINKRSTRKEFQEFGDPEVRTYINMKTGEICKEHADVGKDDDCVYYFSDYNDDKEHDGYHGYLDIDLTKRKLNRGDVR